MNGIERPLQLRRAWPCLEVGSSIQGLGCPAIDEQRTCMLNLQRAPSLWRPCIIL